MPAQMTYSSLLTDMQSYLERTDSAFTTQQPRFVMVAENRIASEMKSLGFQTVVQAAMQAGKPDYPKPAYWRSPISISYTNSSGERVELLLRTYEFCRMYWPSSSARSSPKYYADYNYDNLLIAPTPDAAYDWEIQYYARLTPLDASTQRNWLTDNAPQLLLAACLNEAFKWTKNLDRADYWDGVYKGMIAALNGEDASRLSDRAQNVRGKPV